MAGSPGPSPRPTARPAGCGRCEHDPEKAWPGLDPGWIPVFGKSLPSGLTRGIVLQALGRMGRLALSFLAVGHKGQKKSAAAGNESIQGEGMIRQILLRWGIVGGDR